MTAAKAAKVPRDLGVTSPRPGTPSPRPGILVDDLFARAIHGLFPDRD